MATSAEFNLGFQREVVGVTITEYYNCRTSANFPSCLALNRAYEEPPYPRCIQRAITWRRIISCMAPDLRPDYFLTNHSEASEEGYSNVTWRIGNLCIQIVAVTNAKLLSIDPAGPVFSSQFKSASYQPLKDDDLLQLRVIGHKNLCVLGLLLFNKYLEHAWSSTYHRFLDTEDTNQGCDRFRSHAILWQYTLKCVVYSRRC